MVQDASSLSRAHRAMAALLVVLGGWGAVGTFGPLGSYPVHTPLWLAAGIAALGTAWSGVRLLQERVGAAPSVQEIGAVVAGDLIVARSDWRCRCR